MNFLTSLALIFNATSIPLRSYKPPDDASLYNKTTPEIAAQDGYPMESHYVTTSDGYILGIHRIPYSNVSVRSRTTNKPVVILHHGIATSSSCWFLNSPGKRLPYMLADAGYDVWLANGRGNPYSRNHTYLNSQDRRFWDFSCQEMALIDLPALIDYILNQTGHTKVSFVGHSMGNTIYFMLTSAIPSYNAKITVAVALAPVAFASHMKCPPALILAPMVRDPGPATEAVMDIFGGTGEFFLTINEPWQQKMTAVTCAPFMFAWSICSLPAFVTFGFDYAQLNTSIMDDLWGHLPQPTSIKTFIHFGQFVNTGRFCKFDYGVKKNRQIYNADTPPEFPLENISAPLYLIAARNDFLAMPNDVATLRSKLTGVDEVFTYVDFPTFNHIDFLIAIDANTYVNYPVLRILNDHNGMW